MHRQIVKPGETVQTVERIKEERDHYREQYFEMRCKLALLEEETAAKSKLLRELEDPEEVRLDGSRVLKGRWESAVRNLTSILGIEGEFEVRDIVEAVRALVNREKA